MRIFKVNKTLVVFVGDSVDAVGDELAGDTWINRIPQEFAQYLSHLIGDDGLSKRNYES
jgi:hypothetical protein